MLIILKIKDNTAHFPKAPRATQEACEAWRRGQPDFYSCVVELIYMGNRIMLYLALCQVVQVLK